MSPTHCLRGKRIFQSIALDLYNAFNLEFSMAKYFFSKKTYRFDYLQGFYRGNKKTQQGRYN